MLLDIATSKADATGRRIPLERIKHNYDETSYRQLALEIQNATEARLAKSDPRTHAAYHVEHGRDLLQQGFIAEAGQDFREAIVLDPTNAAAHAGLAAVLEASSDPENARKEANTALKLQPTAEAYLVLARLDLRDNNTRAAAANVDHALALQPTNAAALALKRSLPGTVSDTEVPQ
jgi:Flp pilus assembly protein TadD